MQKHEIWGISKGGEGSDRPYYAFFFVVVVVIIVLQKFGGTLVLAKSPSL